MANIRRCNAQEHIDAAIRALSRQVYRGVEKTGETLVVLAFLFVMPCFLYGQGIQVSGGVDLRCTHQNHPNADDPRLEGLFLNLRKVWSDDLGDRWIGVAQGDFDDNFQRIRPYQVYLQYKGPLGKWNVRAGHYLLSFGLLATYDTERLLLQGLEKTSLGIRKDTGATVFGHFAAWDYAASLTDGLSDIKFSDSRANPVFTWRIAYVRNDWQLGLSTLVGRVLIDPDFGVGNGIVRERRLAVDVTKPFGPLTLRAEAVGGTDDGHAVGGGIVLADYAITPKLELNARFADWQKDGGRRSPGVGFTYQITKGLFGRLAETYNFGRQQRNEFTVQLYYEFSKQF